MKRWLTSLTYKLGRCLLPYHLRRKRISQKEFADMLGKTEPTISRYVNNQIIMSYETAFNAAIILGCEMSELYEWKKVKK